MKLYVCPHCGYEESVLGEDDTHCPKCGFAYADYKPEPFSPEPQNDFFSDVDCAIFHSFPGQEERLGRSHFTTILYNTIDEEKKAACFLGANGTQYETTLHSCTCEDFKSRALPCKHMYRLAEELEMMTEYQSVYPASFKLKPDQLYVNLNRYCAAFASPKSKRYFSENSLNSHKMSGQSTRIYESNFTKLISGSLSSENFSADFFESFYRTEHTTLESCTCEDFRTHHLPCKHMYRLAYEFGIVRVKMNCKEEEIDLCPVCKKYTFEEDYTDCEVCGWGHDLVQEKYPDWGGCFNRLNLFDAKEAYAMGLTSNEIYMKAEDLEHSLLTEEQKDLLQKLWKKYFRHRHK